MPRRHSKLLLPLAGAIVVALLIGVAVVLTNLQAGDRSDVEDRFTRRPQLSAALTSAIFTASTSSSDQQKQLTNRYGDERVPRTETLTKDAREGDSAFVALLDEAGKTIASSADTPPAVRRELERVPESIQAVLDGRQPFALTDYIDLGADGAKAQAFVQPVEGEFGRRILVTGFPPETLGAFLGQTLAELVGITGGDAYILDSTGAVIASSDPVVRPTEPVPVPDLAEAVASSDAGSVGTDEYFAAAPIENSTWRVVSVAPESDVFAAIDGWNRWTPWVIFAAFTLAALAAFALLWRVVRGANELADAHAQLDASNRALQQRARALERSNAELDQFASIASHDLKEPLRKVQMFSQRATDVDGDRLSEQGRDYLRRSADAASRMETLIEDLLKYSRVGTMDPTFEEIDLEQTVREVASDLEGTVEAAGGSIEIGELPTVLADEAQMRQLFQNLISNAIKFRRDGVPPVVRIEGDVRASRAEIRVSDNGIGFDPRYGERIFRVFERLHGRGVYEGTGIGLALCRKIAERNGGAIAGHGTPGAGSTFTVTLPAQRGVERTPAPAADRTRETAGV